MPFVTHIRQSKISGRDFWIAKICVSNSKGKILFDCWALEDKKKCPPVGAWPLILEYSPKFDRELYEMKEIPGRSEIKYHTGNTLQDTDGCPLLGANYIGSTVYGSRLAFDKFMRTLRGTKETFVVIGVQK